AKRVIVEFLKCIDFSGTSFTRDPAMESQVEDFFRTWDNKERVRPYINTGISTAEAAYAHISSTNVKASIAIYTALIAIMDDPRMFSSSHCHDIPQKLFLGSVQQEGNNVESSILRIVAMFWDVYPPLNASMMATATLGFINGCLLENGIGICRAMPFVELQRNLSGASIAFACFIWEKSRFPDEAVYVQALPDAAEAMNRINDILSFYKEVLEGDTSAYVSNRVVVTGKPVQEVLHEIVAEAVTAVERARGLILTEEARGVWDSFVIGFILFHVNDPRYRLSEFLGDEYLIDVDKH
ncbi:terpenoid synthase, partial [Wolfiporia cocos MD-104 SS10]